MIASSASRTFLVILLSMPVLAAGLDILQPRPACPPNTTCAPGTAPKKCESMYCFINSEGQAEYEKENNCKFPTDNCTEKWRLDKDFLEESEGRLRTDGYIPTYDKDIKDKKGNVIHKKGEVIGQSGVTISTGVDLGQQSAVGTKAVIDSFIKDKGNPDKVDVAALMKKLEPYFGLKKQQALDALAKTPLTVTAAEAKLLADAFGYDTQKRVAQRFDAKSTQGMKFKMLPTEAQTVIAPVRMSWGVVCPSGLHTANRPAHSIPAPTATRVAVCHSPCRRRWAV